MKINFNVCVLLSTYNGGKFLRQQIDSVLNQKNINVFLFIRDDGSTDPLTLRVLSDYAEYENIKILIGDNLGVVGSFWQLLKDSPKADYYAFCDQDDLWGERKLIEAVKLLNITNSFIPLLYCSSLEYVDVELNTIGFSRKPKSTYSLKNSIVENIATGCTVIINNELRDIALKTKSIDSIVMHDWWLYLLASAYGSVVFDSNSYIKYRQHDNNVVGGTPNYYINLLRRVKRFSSRKNNVAWINQAISFIDQFGVLLLEKDKRKFDFVFAYDKNFISRFKVLCSSNAPSRNLKFDDFVFKVMFLFKLF
jgi:glycosyltransferase involved in cell wall biosynthesis